MHNIFSGRSRVNIRHLLLLVSCATSGWRVRAEHKVEIDTVVPAGRRGCPS